ncbi:50S ribosomal protein L29 [Aliifodinibius sp. S!AR15-10]|jgi:large subunit ribosomal protein L29|uniref:50S ribosomal protein L29 n=1 Tax=Aliifodinibius sp. S!AR15-10 TaxID=2950437 RepID=UPI0028645E64|nr:50S ribosomal protein L29 [Aliifodinibius sp. S!AR15-10]MDR8394506.1 50S ribosomal protein L29 [Aliifodinibius sp. S!AR15-10]
MKAHEMRDLTVTELKARLNDEQEALKDMQFNKAVAGQLENPARIRMTKREIARLKTVIHEMENEESRSEDTE